MRIGRTKCPLTKENNALSNANLALKDGRITSKSNGLIVLCQGKIQKTDYFAILTLVSVTIGW